MSDENILTIKVKTNKDEVVADWSEIEKAISGTLKDLGNLPAAQTFAQATAEMRKAATSLADAQKRTYADVQRESKVSTGSQISDAKALYRERAQTAKDIAALEDLTYRQSRDLFNQTTKSQAQDLKNLTREYEQQTKDRVSAEREADALIAQAHKEASANAKRETAGMFADMEAQAKVRASRMAALFGGMTAGEARHSAGSGIAGELPMVGMFQGMTGKGLLGAGGTMAAAGGYATLKASEFEREMVMMRNNTSMTDAEFVKLRADAIALGTETGAAFGDIAVGMRQIMDVGFTGSDAIKIVAVATKAAIATGTDVKQTADLLASTMHVFHYTADEAAGAMGTLYVAAQKAKAPFGEFVENGRQAIAVGASMGDNLASISALLSALSRNGFNVAEGATQIKNAYLKVEQPTAKVREQLKLLSDAYNKTHKDTIDLNADFTRQGIETKTLVGVYEDLAKVVGKHTDLIGKVLPAQKGALGAIVLTGNGLKDLKDAFKATNDTVGSANQLAEANARAMATEAQKAQIVQREWEALTITVGGKFLPVAKRVTDTIGSWIDRFNKLDPATQNAIIQTGTWAAGFMLAVGTIGKMIIGLAELRTALGLTATAEGATATEGAAAFAAGGPWMLAIAAAAGAVLLIKRNWDAAKEAHEDYETAAANNATSNDVAKFIINDSPRTDIKHEIVKIQTEQGQIHDKIDIRNDQIAAAIEHQRELRHTAGLPAPVLAASEATITRLGKERNAFQASYNALEVDRKKLSASFLASSPISGSGALPPGIDKDALGHASCAIFASEYLQSKGIKIAKTASAPGLVSEFEKAGATKVPIGQASANDLIVWHGSQYGAMQANGKRSGYHVGVGLGNGRAIQDNEGNIGARSTAGASYALRLGASSDPTYAAIMAEEAALGQGKHKARLAKLEQSENEADVLASQGKYPAAIQRAEDLYQRDINAGMSYVKAKKTETNKINAINKEWDEAKAKIKHAEAEKASRSADLMEGLQDNIHAFDGPESMKHFRSQQAGYQTEYDKTVNNPDATPTVKKLAKDLLDLQTKQVNDEMAKAKNVQSDKDTWSRYKSGGVTGGALEAYFKQRIEDYKKYGDLYLTQIDVVQGHIDEVEAQTAARANKVAEALNKASSGENEHITKMLSDDEALFKKGQLSAEAFADALDGILLGLKAWSTNNPGGTDLVASSVNAVNQMKDTLASELGKQDAKVDEGAKELWDSIMKPADDAFQTTIDNLFKRGKQRTSGKDILRTFGESELNGLLKLGEKSATRGLYSNDPSSIGQVLKGLFGGSSKGQPGGSGDVTLPGQQFHPNATSGGNSNPFGNIGSVFKGAKTSMIEGAATIFTAAQALSAATGAGGQKKKYGGLLGMVAGGIIGSLVPGGWMLGASIGGQVGGMLPFSSGGLVPGVGHLDSVPAILTPGERVLTRSQNAAYEAGAGGTVINMPHNFYGSINEASDLPRIQRDSAGRAERVTRTPSSIPTTF